MGKRWRSSIIYENMMTESEWDIEYEYDCDLLGGRFFKTRWYFGLGESIRPLGALVVSLFQLVNTI